MDVRKTMTIKETITADGVGKACDPVTRVVAMAVCHRMRKQLGVAHITELLPLATATADVISQIIVRHRAKARRGDGLFNRPY